MRILNGTRKRNNQLPNKRYLYRPMKTTAPKPSSFQRTKSNLKKIHYTNEPNIQAPHHQPAFQVQIKTIDSNITASIRSNAHPNNNQVPLYLSSQIFIYNERNFLRYKSPHQKIFPKWYQSGRRTSERIGYYQYLRARNRGSKDSYIRLRICSQINWWWQQGVFKQTRHMARFWWRDCLI